MLSMTIDVYGTCSASNSLFVSALSPTGDPAHVLGAGAYNFNEQDIRNREEGTLEKLLVSNTLGRV